MGNLEWTRKRLFFITTPSVTVVVTLSSHTLPGQMVMLHPALLIAYILVNPISTGLFYLVVALGGLFSTPSIQFDPDILEH